MGSVGSTHEREEAEVIGWEDDTYDPRDPANIMPASEEQIEEIQIAMLEQQIRCIQGSIVSRERDSERQILEHYKSVLFSLQCSLQTILDRKDGAESSTTCESSLQTMLDRKDGAESSTTCESDSADSRSGRCSTDFVSEVAE